MAAFISSGRWRHNSQMDMPTLDPLASAPMTTQPSSGDLTPISGSQTDVAPLGGLTPPPPHEPSTGSGARDWSRLAALPEYRSLVAAKRRFIVWATAFFIVYYFLLAIAVGWAPELMKREVWGKANLAYLFGFSQFIMAWVVAAIYTRAAAGWDRRAAELLDLAGER